MENINYNDVASVRLHEFKIAQIFLLRYLGPGCCDDWETKVLFPIVSKYDNYNWYNLYIDQTTIPFPPENIPCFYIYFNNWKYPYIFSGEKTFKEYNEIFSKLQLVTNGLHPTAIFD
jgi:hypothetical protein